MKIIFHCEISTNNLNNCLGCSFNKINKNKGTVFQWILKHTLQTLNKYVEVTVEEN